MEYTTYASRLRYLDADDVDDAVVDYDGLDVRGPGEDTIGQVKGFIVDALAGRVYYVVVDSGGWFRSRRFLLPIGHATLDSERKSLSVDVTRDRLTRYPEFDEDRFRTFSDEELRTFETRVATACCPDESLTDVSVPGGGYAMRRHYAQPSWWPATTHAYDRLRPIDTSPDVRAAVPAGSRLDREHVTARERTPEGLERLDGDGFSPHLDGRAQPGDVLGIETGGERTAIGDTVEEEDRRRRAAEAAVLDAEEDGPHLSER